MPILVTCHECRFSFRVKDELGGRKGKCPKCLAMLIVPPAQAPVARPQPATGKNHEAELIAEIRGGFNGELAQYRTTLMYRLALVFVAIFVVVVPLLFLAFAIGALFFAFYLFTVPVTVRMGRVFVLLWIMKLSFAVAMCMMVFYMMRTMFSGFGRESGLPDFALDEHPALAALVRELAGRLKSPVPARVEFTCDCNAFARYGRGVMGSLVGRELTLGVGLPLLGCTTTTEMAGVIAHELQHFSQLRTARLRCVIGAVNHRLGVAAYHPEQAAYQESLEVRDGLTQYYDMALMVSIALGRAVMIFLYTVSAAVSAALCRQQEYESDLSEAQVGGAKAFVRTMRKLSEHGMGTRKAYKAAGSCLSRRCLPDDLPALILASTRELNEDHLEAMHDRLAKEGTGLLDLHPSPRDWIDAVRRVNAKGIFKCERPARELVRNYRTLCKASTRGTLFEMFGNGVNTMQFAGPAELFPHWEALRDELEVPSS